MKTKMLFAALAASLIAGSASALTVSATGDFLEIAAPADVKNGSPTNNDKILYFNEQQNVTLTTAITLDDGSTLGVGRRVNSHMFFLNREGGGPTTVKQGTLTFANNILGTMSDIHGALLDATDSALGAIGTTYQQNLNNRGLESNDFLDFTGNTVEARLRVTQPGDWVRVVTAAPIPVPAGILLLPLGLGALGALRRRKNKTA